MTFNYIYSFKVTVNYFYSLTFLCTLFLFHYLFCFCFCWNPPEMPLNELPPLGLISMNSWNCWSIIFVTPVTIINPKLCKNNLSRIQFLSHLKAFCTFHIFLTNICKSNRIFCFVFVNNAGNAPLHTRQLHLYSTILTALGVCQDLCANCYNVDPHLIVMMFYNCQFNLNI